MCGILGVHIHSASTNKELFGSIAKRLFSLSESRGKEASGFCSINGRGMEHFRYPFAASDLMKHPAFQKAIDVHEMQEYRCLFGHSRLVTNGYEHDNINNQPVTGRATTLVHNGIVVNHDKLWKNVLQSTPTSMLDTEVIPALIRQEQIKKQHLVASIASAYKHIEGMTSIISYFHEEENLYCATNNGSLYYLQDLEKGWVMIASERNFLEQIQAEFSFPSSRIFHLSPRSILRVNLHSQKLDVFDFDGAEAVINTQDEQQSVTTTSVDLNEKYVIKVPVINTSLEHHFERIPEWIAQFCSEREREIDHLCRCSRCILPSTFPFIEFDEHGVCNYCNSYKPIVYRGGDLLQNEMNGLKRSRSAHHDCLIPFSGGRDSSYVLHYVKHELGLRPLAFSYDWGMLTDLARRNQSRMCGALGVEHVLISADIRKKRLNIQKNVSAWLKRPSLGTIPLFMAGDKQYFYYANQLLTQNHLSLSIMGENLLETTRFKTGFCGVRPQFDTEKTYSLTQWGKLQMMMFYAKEFALNPSYINSSLVDTLDAFKSYYVMEHRSINVFDYLKWDEDLVNQTIINGYNWEIDPETTTTWRIGDGTAAFYNYIYWMIAGFTENDTFRSNQIREGTLTREDALKKVMSENQPRWDSIRWYCNVIQMDFLKVIKVIHSMPKLYPACAE